MLACYGGFAPLFPLYVFFRGMPKGVGEPGGSSFFYGRLAPCSLMLLFFASPKKSNQKKGESYADGGPQRTACGCWLWRVAATHPVRVACPRRSACFARTRPNAAVGASGGFLVRVRFAAARVGACGGVPHARSLCINNQVLITRLYY